MKIITNTEHLCCEEALQCAFDLKNLDLKVYKILQKNGEQRADEIAKEINKERSTVYRSLQKLTKCGICNKKRNNIKKGGGYYHTYECNNSEKIKIKLEECIDNWYKKMKETIKKI